MANETVEKVVVTHTPTGNVEKQTIVRSGPSISEFFVSKTNQVIFAFIGVIDLLLLLRVMFLLLGANNVGVVSWILAITQVFVAPFTGIFPSQAAGNSYFDVASVVAIIMYLVFGVILGVIIDLFSNTPD